MRFSIKIRHWKWRTACELIISKTCETGCGEFGIESPNVWQWCLLLIVIGISGCTQDFRVRRVEAVPTARTQERNPRISFDAGAMPTLPSSTADQETRRRATEQWIDAYGGALLAAPGHTLLVPIASGLPFPCA